MSDGGGAHTLSDTTKEEREVLFVPSSSSHRDPNRAPTEVAPSTPVPPDEETPSIPETPKFDPDSGRPPSGEPAIGVATKIEAADGVFQTPPLLSRFIQGHLEQTGVEACPKHKMDDGVRDPNCDHCKRALGPLRYQYLLICVRSLGDMRLAWAFGFENRQVVTVLACIQAAFEDR